MAMTERDGSRRLSCEPARSSHWWQRVVGEQPHEVGQHPDYRFTLANERIFLAWIRTSLALVAGGIAVVRLGPWRSQPLCGL
jgi:uncharacterized membrane protein YidH (DUF202 family)